MSPHTNWNKYVTRGRVWKSKVLQLKWYNMSKTSNQPLQAIEWLLPCQFCRHWGILVTPSRLWSFSSSIQWWLSSIFKNHSKIEVADSEENADTWINCWNSGRRPKERGGTKIVVYVQAYTTDTDPKMAWSWMLSVIHFSNARPAGANFDPLEVVSRWRDPQLQVSENWRWTYIMLV